MSLRTLLLSTAVLLIAVPAAAQKIDLSAHVAAARWSEFDGIDKGLGGRISFKPVPLIGIEAEGTWYPGDYTDEGPPFSRRRVEGLLGVTAGPKIGPLRPFVKAAGGFLKVSPTSGAFACIAIFPPPLSCVLAGGETLRTYEVGAGIELDVLPRVFLRGDLTQRFLQYPGPTFDDDFEVRDEDFFGGAPRFTLGAGIRF